MPKPVSQEARQRMSRAQRSRHLTARQERFVKAYACLGNGSEACRHAGYKPGPRIGQIAVENLQKPAVVSALKRELARIELKISPERVQRRLDEISHEAQSAGQFGPAVRAEELLGKSVGLFIDRSILLSGTMNDSHIAALLETRQAAATRADRPGRRSEGRGRVGMDQAHAVIPRGLASEKANEIKAACRPNHLCRNQMFVA